MITPIYAAILSMLLIALSIHVIKGRRLLGIGIGDLNNLEMKRRIRAQANFAEYSPLFLILLFFVENAGAAHWLIHGIAIAFIAGRLMHAYSLLCAEKYSNAALAAKPIWRIRGMQCTFFTFGLLSITVLVQNLIR